MWTAVITPGGHSPTIHGDGRFEIPVCLLAPCEPGDRVGLQIRPIETLGQLPCFGRVVFHRSQIEQQERGARVLQHYLAALLDLQRIEVTTGRSPCRQSRPTLPR
jgi:hypothetical protein